MAMQVSVMRLCAFNKDENTNGFLIVKAIGEQHSLFHPSSKVI